MIRIPCPSGGYLRDPFSRIRQLNTAIFERGFAAEERRAMTAVNDFTRYMMGGPAPILRGVAGAPNSR